MKEFILLDPSILVLVTECLKNIKNKLVKNDTI